VVLAYGLQLVRFLERIEIEGGEPETAASGRRREGQLHVQPPRARPGVAAMHDPEARRGQLTAAAQNLQCQDARSTMIRVCIPWARREH